VEPPATDNILPTVQEMKKGPGRPKKIKTGLPGRPKRVPNMVPVTETATVAQVPDPENVKEALDGPNADEWKNAIREEYLAHMSNRTWEIVDRPNNRKPIGSRFVLKTKLDRNGDVDRRKAGLRPASTSAVIGLDKGCGCLDVEILRCRPRIINFSFHFRPSFYYFSPFESFTGCLRSP